MKEWKPEAEVGTERGQGAFSEGVALCGRELTLLFGGAGGVVLSSFISTAIEMASECQRAGVVEKANLGCGGRCAFIGTPGSDDMTAAIMG